MWCHVVQPWPIWLNDAKAKRLVLDWFADRDAEIWRVVLVPFTAPVRELVNGGSGPADGSE